MSAYLMEYSNTFYGHGQPSEFDIEELSFEQATPDNSHYLAHGQTPPVVAASLEDYVVQKRHNKGKGKHTHNKSASISKRPPPKNEIRNIDQPLVGPEASPTFAKSMKAQGVLPTATKALDGNKLGISMTSRRVLFDYPPVSDLQL